jgi:hypothetical protein
MSTDVAVKIRLATLDDVERLTEMHCASFQPEDHVPVMLGRRYVRATYRWLVTSREAYALVAEVGSTVAGVVGVCDRSFSSPMFKACLGEFVLSLVRNPTLLLSGKLWQRLYRRSSPATDKGALIAGYFGVAQMTIGVVDAGFRGKSIFPALIEATKSFSKSRGSRAIRGGIYKPNSSSRRVFVKGGWIETPDLETEDTVFYMAYLDPSLPDELQLPQSDQTVEVKRNA